jgi:hypothetical protein
MNCESLYENSVQLSVESTVVRVAGIEHLIALKRTAARLKALDDVKRLMELQEKQTVTYDKKNIQPPTFGSWQSAEELRKWSFLQRSPQQRLDWLVEVLCMAYRCGALKEHPLVGEGKDIQTIDRPASSGAPWP